MKIAYCTNTRMPTERAHGHQIAQVCQALIQLNHQVHIFAPYRHESQHLNLADYYQVSSKIQLTHLGTIDYIRAMYIPGLLRLYLMNSALRKMIKQQVHKATFDMAYTRCLALVPALAATGLPVILELHQLPKWLPWGWLATLKRCRLVVCLTTQQRHALVTKGVPAEQIIVAADGVDEALLQAELPNRDTVRTELGIPANSFCIGYAGSFTTMGLSKGVEVIIEALAAGIKQGKQWHLVLAGGPPEAVQVALNLAATLGVSTQVTSLGQLPRAEVNQVYAAADVLVYPAPVTDHSYFMRDTSPLKILEYMTTGKPIITADLPPIHDLLTTQSAHWFTPGNTSELTNAITQAQDSSDSSKPKAALAAVQQHTWQQRMAKVLAALS